MNSFPHYFKALPTGCTHVDVYRVLQLFEVTDPALQHAAKKLLCAGARGAKDLAQDIAEAIATLQRWQQMREEEKAKVFVFGVDPGAQSGDFSTGFVVESRPSPTEEPERRKAPWPDFAGNPIFEGDWIVHPSGQRARVRFDPGETSSPGWSEWRCDYDGLLHGMSLALQIGDRGMAVVEVEKPAEDPERAAYLRRWESINPIIDWLSEDFDGACYLWIGEAPPLRDDGRFCAGGGAKFGGPAHLNDLLGSVRCEPRPGVSP